MSDASPWAFSHSDEVRFADLDVMGHLNNVAFLVFAESARVGYMRVLMPNRDLVAGDFGVMIAETKIRYRAPGHFGERIETRLRPADLGRTSFRVDFEMRVGDRVIADGYTVMVLYDRSAARPMSLPKALRQRLAADGARERPPERAARTEHAAPRAGDGCAAPTRDGAASRAPDGAAARAPDDTTTQGEAHGATAPLTKL